MFRRGGRSFIAAAAFVTLFLHVSRAQTETKEEKPFIPQENATFQIVTYGSPPRCLHIDIDLTEQDEGNDGEPMKKCLDVTGWSDGVNGCSSYTASPDWCETYGHIVDSKIGTSAKESCCICGGGRQNHPLRFKAGDAIKIFVGQINTAADESRVLPVGVVAEQHKQKYNAVEVEAVVSDAAVAVGTAYGVKLTKDAMIRFVHGKEKAQARIPRGMEFNVAIDDDSYIRKAIIPRKRDVMELRKCAKTKAQEFRILEPPPLPPPKPKKGETPSLPKESDKRHDAEFLIQHVASNAIIAHDFTLPFRQRWNKFVVWPDEPGSLDLTKDATVQIEKVFTGEAEFVGSDTYIHLLSRDNTTRLPLSHGEFGRKQYSDATWQNPRQVGEGTPFSMWSLRQLAPLDPTATEGDEGDEHAEWLAHTVTKEKGIDTLKQLAPWKLLHVDRQADEKTVKARFRSLSRRFHPDKNKGDMYNQLFVLLQKAYDGMKFKDEKKREQFLVNAEVEEQLFAHSKHVVELLPDMWQKLEDEERYGTEGRYVISTNRSKDDLLRENDVGANATSRVWIVFLYSPRCGMSRAVVPFLEDAAIHLSSETNSSVRVGAYGCGIYGESLLESKKKGHSGAFTDAICKQFGRQETPSTHAVVEVVNSEDEEFRKRAADWTNFYATAATGTILDLWPKKIVSFAMTSLNAWKDSHLVETYTKHHFLDESFLSTVRIVAFIDDTATMEQQEKEIQKALFVALPSIAKRIQKANNVRVGVAACATSDNEDDDGVDCADLGVAWLPDVKVFGVNQTRGVSLLGNSFAERRDVQIALEALSNTIIGLYGVEYEEATDVLDEEPEVEPQDGGSCSSGEQPPPMDMMEKELLEGSLPIQELGADEQKKDSLDSPPNKPKLAEIPTDQKASLDSPKKPKLAKRNHQSRALPEYDKPKSAQRQLGGGGRIYGGHGHTGGGSLSAG